MTTQATIHTILAQHLVSSGWERNFKTDEMDAYSKVNVSIAELAIEITKALNVAAQDQPQPLTDENAPTVQTIAGFRFERLNDDKWIAFSTATRTPLFELTRQDYEGNDGSDDPALQDDWGFWDVELDDWAHAPQETGYPDFDMAVAGFTRYVSTLPGH